MKEKQTKKRREFLALGLLAGAGALTGNNVGKALAKNGKKTRLITADGKVMEVDSRYLPPSFSEPLSNVALQQWLDEEKSNK